MSKSFKNMSAEELTTQLYELRKEQFNFRMRRAVGDLPRPHLFKELRRDIARIKTELACLRKSGA